MREAAVTPDPLPMAEAQQFWRDKVKLSSGEFARLSAEAKTRAFAVAGIARGDELDTVFAALQRAIDQGTTFADFKAQCAEIFERRGWTGRRAWRVDNIFRTNIQTAYNVGHYHQLAESADTMPYWQYSAVNDSRTRPTHLAMDGRVWPADHPVWDTWFPPNGFRCRCSVIGLTRDQVAARGLEVETTDPTHRLIEPVSPVTGERTVAMQLLPDPGFAHNPGRSFWGTMGEVMARRLSSWPRELSLQFLAHSVGGELFAGWMENPAGEFPVGLLPPDLAGQINAKTGTVVLSAETAAKQLRRHPEITPAEYTAVQEAIDRGEVIRDRDRHLVFILEDGGRAEIRGHNTYFLKIGIVSPDFMSPDFSTGRKVWLVSFRRLRRSGDR